MFKENSKSEQSLKKTQQKKHFGEQQKRVVSKAKGLRIRFWQTR